MAAHGHGLAGSGKATVLWPEWPTLSASVALTGPSARERGDGKRLEQHGHVRARPAAVMATRWSRAHGELYLRQKWDDGGVEDVEELMVVLWFS